MSYGLWASLQLTAHGSQLFVCGRSFGVAWESRILNLLPQRLRQSVRCNEWFLILTSWRMDCDIFWPFVNSYIDYRLSAFGCRQEDYWLLAVGYWPAKTEKLSQDFRVFWLLLQVFQQLIVLWEARRIRKDRQVQPTTNVITKWVNVTKRPVSLGMNVEVLAGQ